MGIRSRELRALLKLRDEESNIESEGLPGNPWREGEREGERERGRERGREGEGKREREKERERERK